MDYNEAKSYIAGLNSRGISPGLENETELLKSLGNPEQKLNIVHIAGTNGKGSFGAYLDSIIRTDGASCARFVSPCVGEYLNTYIINGLPVSQNDFIEALSKVKSVIEALEKRDIYITSFEAETAVAFLIFLKYNPDYVLLECGMGGRLDSTNVIPLPALSVITKISLDHTAFLGDTISKIASEKAGIIKNNSKVVTTIQTYEAHKVIKEKCSMQNSDLFIADEPTDILYSDLYTSFKVGDVTYKTYMLGAYQPQNAALAIKAAEILNIDSVSIKRGIEQAAWPYRFERIGKFILDGAHNGDAAKMLAYSLQQYITDENTAFICACFKDKDYEKIAEYTAHFAKKVYCIKAPTNRGLDPKILCDAFKSEGADACVSQSLENAINDASSYNNVVIFGTLSILYDAKQIILRRKNDETMQ